MKNFSSKIMGIVNVTPDSFSDGGHYLNIDRALSHIETLITEGADIIDIGAESSRPGSTPVTLDEELHRLEPLLKQYKTHFSTPLSVDTYKSEVAELAIGHGATYINDITALNFDEKMAKVIGKSKTSVILMHMNGTPKSMQENPTYTDVVDEVKSSLKKSILKAENAGIDDIIIDPGIGFGKSLNNTLKLIQNLSKFSSLSKQILIGTSRKSFIGHITNDDPTNRLEGTIASCVVARQNGASIFRVHDVKSVKKAIQVCDHLMEAR